MIEFPDSPTIDQIVSAGSASWRWDGRKWLAVSGGTFLLHKLVGNPTEGPGANLALLYVVPGTGTSATLRLQAGTDPIPLDILVNVGSGF